jgi:hypothetical protein
MIYAFGNGRDVVLVEAKDSATAKDLLDKAGLATLDRTPTEFGTMVRCSSDHDGYILVVES